jgi:ribosomal-protein-alanine N-acetyltransferase
MRISAVLPDQSVLLAAIHAASFAKGWSAEDINECLTSHGGFGLAAIETSYPLGFLLARAMAGEAEILTLAVDPTRRRQGVARALLRAALQAAQSLGAESLFLEVASDNVAAIGLYEGLGFAAAGLRRGYYPRLGEAAQDALVLSRRLNSDGS